MLSSCELLLTSNVMMMMVTMMIMIKAVQGQALLLPWENWQLLRFQNFTGTTEAEGW